MHPFPKIFTSNNKSKSNSKTMNFKPKPKLTRRNAAKNINYDYSPSTSASTSSSSSTSSHEDCLRTRSLELYGNKTSFRIDGSIEGEVELLCKTLGFSGIEDFAIPEEEYAAMKLRTASSAPLLDRGEIDLYDRTSDNVISTNCDTLCFNNNTNNNNDVISANCDGLCFNSNNNNDNDDVGKRSGNNGIKGVRPPPLVEKECCSTSDVFRGNSESVRSFSRFRVDGNEGVVEEGGSCSFTTSSCSNDDSSSTTTPMSSNSPGRRFRRVIVDWDKGDLLGQGSFGSVYEGISGDGFFFAVKEVSLLDQDNDGKQRILQLEQEIALLSRFEHENIVQYYGTEKDESRLYIFLELVTQGSLLSLYRKYNLRDPQVSGYTRQILHGLKYLHDKNVVHRDIKCANILVDTNGLVKLADFGLAKATKLNDVKSCKGTPLWMAPEVVKCLGYGLPADIWSLGCSVLEMLTRSFPYSNLEPMAAIFKIGRGERPHIPDSLSSDARDFIQNCLQVDPNMRPTATQLLDHPFVKRPLPQASGLASPRLLAGRSY